MQMTLRPVARQAVPRALPRQPGRGRAEGPVERVGGRGAAAGARGLWEQAQVGGDRAAAARAERQRGEEPLEQPAAPGGAGGGGGCCDCYADWGCGPRDCGVGS